MPALAFVRQTGQLWLGVLISQLLQALHTPRRHRIAPGGEISKAERWQELEKLQTLGSQPLIGIASSQLAAGTGRSVTTRFAQSWERGGCGGGAPTQALVAAGRQPHRNPRVPAHYALLRRRCCHRHLRSC